MKKKSLTMLLTGLLAVSLTGVGFASWIIVQGDEKGKEGQVLVEDIEKYNLTLTPEWDAAGDTLKFGSSSNAATGWLKNTTTEGEVKELTLNVTLGDYEHASSVDYTFEITAGLDGYNSAVSAKYITGISINDGTATQTLDNTGKVTGSLTKAATYTIKISYAWGATFGNENPYDFYNDPSVTDPFTQTVPDTEDTYAEHAYEHIGTMYDNLSPLKFKLTLKSK